jgi:FkbM family methyltransferase
MMGRRFRLGALFLVVCVLCVVAARRPVHSAWSLLRANWNSDLRQEFIGYRRIVRHYDVEAYSRSCSIVRSEGGYNLWQSPIGEFWMPRTESVDAIGEMAEIIDRNTYQYRGRTVRPGDVVIDCGAHLGSFIRKSLRLGASLVVGIEPSSAKIECMRRTFADEITSGRVRLLQVGVWRKDDKLWLPGEPNMGNSLVEHSTERENRVGEWVMVTTLDKIAAAEKLERLDFLKMDIEGAEVDALAGASESIRRFRPFLAIAVEHTSDLAQNARNVLRTVATNTALAATEEFTGGLLIRRGRYSSSPNNKEGRVPIDHCGRKPDHCSDLIEGVGAGIDFHKPRMGGVAGAVLVLSPCPGGFTASELAS